jgi:hypothetical protein
MKTWIFSLLFVVLIVLASVESKNARFERVCKNKEIQVLSDVDDTLKASGTNFVAGVDTRWPGGSLYAGLGYFYLELSRGPKETLNPLTPGVVSARPEQLAGSFPDVEKEFLLAAEGTKGISAEWAKIKVILPGEVDDNLHLHSAKRYRDYAETKVKNVKKFAAANPDKCIIFMGDNGQGDQLAGKQMLDDLPDQVAAIFIHNVTDAPPLHVDPWENIFLFTTYVDAASIAFEEGFLAAGSVLRVLEGAAKSQQFQDCRACFPEDESSPKKLKCLLTKVSPAFDSVGGGCHSLFHAMETAAAQLSYTKLKIPARRLARELKLETQEDVSLIWWLICKVFQLIIGTGLVVGAIFGYKKYKETQQSKQKAN